MSAPYTAASSHTRTCQLARRVCLALLFVFPPLAFARFHPPVPTVATVAIDADRIVTITILHDALAYALNDTSKRIGDPLMYALLNGPPQHITAACDDARQRFAISTKLFADGSAIPVQVTQSPTLDSINEWKADHPDLRLPCKMDATLRARLPDHAHAFTVRFSEILSDVVVVIDRPDLDAVTIPLAPAETSPDIDVSMIPVRVAPPDPSRSDSNSTPPAPSAFPPASPDSTHEQPAGLQTFWRYTKFGFRHIIPAGPDHALFVLGLFLLSPRLKPTLAQISSFTLAHTITLTLTTLNIVGLSSRIVEPAIALSIAFIGIENLFTTKVHPWRIAVAFLFGLVHGMGVATAFTEAGFPKGQLVQSLVAFTIGVEGGHLLALAAAFLLLGWARRKPWYRQRIAIPLSICISLIALLWTIQRLAP